MRRKTKEREGETLTIIFNVRYLTSGMKKTSFRSTSVLRKLNRGQRKWETPTTSSECTRAPLCGTKPQTRWRRCWSPSSGWTRTKQLADWHRSILKSWIRITTNSKVINIVVLLFMTQCSLVIRKITSTYGVKLPAERGYVFHMIWYDMIYDVVWYIMIYDMIWYLLPEVCFPPVGSVGKIVHK